MNTKTKLTKKTSALAADMNGQTVMLDADSGKYYNLGEVGGRIWALLDEQLTAEELAAKLCAEYDVAEEKCLCDILPFLEKLKNAGLLREEEA